MFDSNWELINGPEAHAIEVLNYSNQINVIEAFFRYFTSKFGIGPTGAAAVPNGNVVKELHRTGTLLLLDKPGEYRDCYVEVAKAGIPVHIPPEWELVQDHMNEFSKDLMAMWEESDPLTIAAYTIWALNWIHPFKNGNGRTARAFSYLCLTLKVGVQLPGRPTVLDLIMENREPYNAALNHADTTMKSTGTPDLAPMRDYLESLLRIQLTEIAGAP